MHCITWLADAGAETMLLVSIASLRRNAPKFWNDAAKLVLDCGLTPSVASFLSARVAERLYCEPISLPPCSAVAGSDSRGGVGAMRCRTEVMNLAPLLCSSRGIQPAGYIVCDADTVFLRSPQEFVFPAGADQITIMPECDISNGRKEAMRLCRRSNFTGPYPLDTAVARAAERLEVDEREFRAIPTFNTGVFGFAAGTNVSAAWAHCYDVLKSVRHDNGDEVFAPFAMEQNAMSLCLHRNIILHRPLDSRFNQFPPRPPSEWPPDTTIAHFISFKTNYREARYEPWFESARESMQDAWLPMDLRQRLQTFHADWIK